MGYANIEEDLDEQIAEAKKEADHWRRVALYLADCHAATASHDGLLSSTSKSRRERFANICRTADAAISGERVDRIHGFSYSPDSDATARVRLRLLDAIELLTKEKS